MQVIYQKMLTVALGFVIGLVGKVKTHEPLQVSCLHSDTRITQDQD